MEEGTAGMGERKYIAQRTREQEGFARCAFFGMAKRVATQTLKPCRYERRRTVRLRGRDEEINAHRKARSSVRARVYLMRQARESIEFDGAAVVPFSIVQLERRCILSEAAMNCAAS